MATSAAITRHEQVKKALGERLKLAREEASLRQEDVANALQVTKMTVRRWEAGRFEPSISTLGELAVLYKVGLETLMADVSALVLVNVHTPARIEEIPIKGYVSAGTPRESWEVDLGTVPVQANILKEYPKAFALVVSGDSLEGDAIHNGDIVVVDPEAALNVGKIYIAQVGDELCARHLYIEDGIVRLKSSNQDYEDVRATGINVVGRVVWHLRKM